VSTIVSKSATERGHPPGRLQRRCRALVSGSSGSGKTGMGGFRWPSGVGTKTKKPPGLFGAEGFEQFRARPLVVTEGL
jgi:hypothetical protein